MLVKWDPVNQHILYSWLKRLKRFSISEDEWLTALYPDQISNFEEYLKFTSRIKPLLSKHIQQILTSGTDVVLDFPANTYQQRTWFKQLFENAHAKHQLIYIDAQMMKFVCSKLNIDE